MLKFESLLSSSYMHLQDLIFNYRLGQVDDARRHLFLAGPQPNPVELQKLQAVERHLGRCVDARKIGDWKSALRESDAAIAVGADSSSLVNS